MLQSFKKISIIMPTYNQGDYIERSIQSVLSQNYPNLEFIVVDNLSDDQTFTIIEKYKAFISLYIREKDSGQSDALNKGFSIATGEFVTWLNSDDILLPNVLHSFNKKAIKSTNIKWFLGNVIWIDKEDYIIKLRKGPSFNRVLANNFFVHAYGPSTFMHFSLLKDFGNLKNDFHYMMDTELWMRLLKHNVEFERLDFYCWCLRLHENAKMSGHNFSSSQLSNLSHPSHLKKRMEHEYIFNNYLIIRKYNFLFRSLFFIHKIFSFNFIESLAQDFFLKRNVKYYDFV